MKDRIDRLIRILREKSSPNNREFSAWERFVYGLRKMCTPEELYYLDTQLALMYRETMAEQWDDSLTKALILPEENVAQYNMTLSSAGGLSSAVTMTNPFLAVGAGGGVSPNISSAPSLGMTVHMPHSTLTK